MFKRTNQQGKQLIFHFLAPKKLKTFWTYDFLKCQVSIIKLNSRIIEMVNTKVINLRSYTLSFGESFFIV